MALQPQYDLAFGEDLKAKAEASDKKVDSLPSFPDIGKSLGAQFGQTDPKDVGKAIDKNTPGIAETIFNPQRAWERYPDQTTAPGFCSLPCIASVTTHPMQSIQDDSIVDDGLVK